MEKTNVVLRKTIAKCEEQARKEDVNLWDKVATELKRSNSSSDPVNLAKLDRLCEAGDTVVVAGKVTGYGRLNKDIDVAAFKFSDSAKKSIESEGNTMSILELLEEKPQGSGVKFIK